MEKLLAIDSGVYFVNMWRITQGYARALCKRSGGVYISSCEIRTQLFAPSVYTDAQSFG